VTLHLLALVLGKPVAENLEKRLTVLIALKVKDGVVVLLLKGQKKKTQTEILVLIEDEGAASGNLAMKVLDYAERWDVAEIVNEKVEPCQRFKSDLWQPNFVLRSMGHKLQAKKSNGPESVVWLPHVHRAISLFKRFLLGTYHGVSAKYLPGYLQEFCFRFNRRHKQEIIWESLLKACCYTVPLKYSELKL
jgi:hypothetical protein